MARIAFGLIFTLALTAPASAQVAVVTPSAPGTVQGIHQNSDAFIWGLLARQIATPTSSGVPTFETWASDEDIFTANPHWPTPNAPHRFHPSVAALAKGLKPDTNDIGCAAPANPSVGRFPIDGCIGEEVKRNWPQYNYIVSNKLNTAAGLASAYAHAFNVNMPASAIAVKADWVPVPTVMQWVGLSDPASVEKVYLTTTAGGTEYALVSLHVSSKQNPNWVWGTFEHSLTPGRCSFTGCYDSFGATVPSVPPNKQSVNVQYGTCAKTPALQALMAQGNLSPVWSNYCLKGSEVNYTAADGTPYVLGNSVTEAINVNNSTTATSCISCHTYASFGVKGTTAAAPFAMLSFNPNGNKIPNVLVGSRQYDFMWGVLLAK